MTTYEANLNYIAEKAQIIHKKLISEKPIFNVQIEPTEDQTNNIITHNGCKCFLNSIYNTEAEMANMVKNADPNTEVFVVFGIANGQIITYLQKHFLNLSCIYIIEPSLELFKDFLSKSLFTDLSKGTAIKIVLLLNISEADLRTEMAGMVMNKNIVFIEHISYRTAFSSYYQQLSYMMLEYLRTYRFNIKILKTLYLVWARSSIINSRYKSFMVDDLLEYIEGKPAIIVSAGPSLKKNMHLLNQVKGKAIMFAGGTTVRVLSNNGITPDFRASIDTADNQNNLFKNVLNENVPLLYRSMSNTKLIKEYHGPKFRAIIEDDYIWKYISEKKGLSKNTVSATPSVSNFIFEVLIKAKCNPIIFVGQDMCSYNNEAHADSKDNPNSYKIKNEIEMWDINGAKVTTDLNHLQFKYTFDRQAKKCNSRIINATEGGLGIEGSEIKTLEAVINEDLTQELDFNIEKIQEIELLKSSYEENYMKIQEALQEIKEESNEISEILIEIFRSIDKYSNLKVKNYKEGKLRKETEHIDMLYSKLMEKGFFKNVVTNATIAITQALDAKYAYGGIDKVKIADNKVAKSATRAEIYYRYVKEFISVLSMQL